MPKSPVIPVHVILDDFPTLGGNQPRFFGAVQAMAEQLAREAPQASFRLSVLCAGRVFAELQPLNTFRSAITLNSKTRSDLAGALGHVLTDYRELSKAGEGTSNPQILFLLGSEPAYGWEQAARELLNWRALSLAYWFSKTPPILEHKRLERVLGQLAPGEAGQPRYKILPPASGQDLLRQVDGVVKGFRDHMLRVANQIDKGYLKKPVGATAAPSYQTPQQRPKTGTAAISTGAYPQGNQAPNQPDPRAAGSTPVKTQGAQPISGAMSEAIKAEHRAAPEGQDSSRSDVSASAPRQELEQTTPAASTGLKQATTGPDSAREATQVSGDTIAAEETTPPGEEVLAEGSASVGDGPAATGSSLKVPAQWEVKEPPPELGDPTSHAATDSTLPSSSTDGWIAVGASRRGKLHEHEGTYRDDSFTIRTEGGWILVAVADGAGSHKLSRVGAKLATEAAVRKMGEVFSANTPSRDIADLALQRALVEAHTALVKEAEARKPKYTFRDLSTTLLLLAYHPKKNFVGAAQVGDGLIVVEFVDPATRESKIALLGSPESGEYSGQTLFLTNHKPEALGSKIVIPPDVPEVRMFFVMTDGVSDDLYPPADRLLGLVRPMPGVMAASDQDARERALLDLIGYERKGSFDDRTLVVACHPERVAQINSREAATIRETAPAEAGSSEEAAPTWSRSTREEVPVESASSEEEAPARTEAK